MENRKQKDVEDIIEFIKRKWELSINEDDCLTSVLDVFRAEENSRIREIEHLLNDEYQSLLDLLPEREIAEFAVEELYLIPKDSEDDLLDALDDLDYNWSDKIELCEHKEILEDHGYTVGENGFTPENIVEESQFEEWKELFSKLSVQERDNILKEKL